MAQSIEKYQRSIGESSWREMWRQYRVISENGSVNNQRHGVMAQRLSGISAQYQNARYQRNRRNNKRKLSSGIS